MFFPITIKSHLRYKRPQYSMSIASAAIDSIYHAITEIQPKEIELIDNGIQFISRGFLKIYNNSNPLLVIKQGEVLVLEDSDKLTVNCRLNFLPIFLYHLFCHFLLLFYHWEFAYYTVLQIYGP
jgi:hypothetical protein